jgi:hypothetical protein
MPFKERKGGGACSRLSLGPLVSFAKQKAKKQTNDTKETNDTKGNHMDQRNDWNQRH